MSPIAMTLVLLTTLGFFSWSAKRRIRQLKVGVPDPDFDLSRPGELFDRTKTLMIFAFFQKKMPNYTLAGLAHVGIFMAFQVLLLNSIMLWGRGFDPTFDFWGRAQHRPPVRQGLLAHQGAGRRRRRDGRARLLVHPPGEEGRGPRRPEVQPAWRPHDPGQRAQRHPGHHLHHDGGRLPLRGRVARHPERRHGGRDALGLVRAVRLAAGHDRSLGPSSARRRSPCSSTWASGGTRRSC